MKKLIPLIVFGLLSAQASASQPQTVSTDGGRVICDESNFCMPLPFPHPFPSPKPFPKPTPGPICPMVRGCPVPVPPIEY